jgi:hypothetical protein
MCPPQKIVEGSNRFVSLEIIVVIDIEITIVIEIVIEIAIVF